jgi:hypothetical protein
LREEYSSPDSAKCGTDEKSHQVSILYEYSVNGVLLRSDVWRVVPAVTSFTRKRENKALARYPIGSAVTVYVNPDNPKDAMLEPGKVPWVLFVAGALFFLAGALCFFHIQTDSQLP